MPDPQRILIIRPSALGDVARSVPVLTSLRRAYPDARIDWLVQDSFADVVRAHPDLTTVVPFARHRLSRAWRPDGLRAIAALKEVLREPRYDLVLDCQGLLRSGLLARLTGSPRRVGYRNARELGRFMLNETHHVARDMHTVDQMLALVEAIGVTPVRDMRLYAPAEAKTTIAAEPWADSRYVVLAPTSRWPGKLWPAERFAEVAAALVPSHAEYVILTGAAEEREQIGPLLTLAERDPRIIDRVGGATIGDLMAMIERAALVIALDSAPLHIAVGFDRPLVALYGPTRVKSVGPYRREADVIQHIQPGDRYRHKDEHQGREMMNRVTVDEVLQAARMRLNRA